MDSESKLTTGPTQNTDRSGKFTSPKVPDTLNADRASKFMTEYKFLNDSYFQSSSAADSHPRTLPFARFSQLPLELRLRIWEHCLPYQRFLRVGISRERSSKATTEPALYQRRNGLGNIVSHAEYVLHMRSTGSCSPLLLVNREASSFVRKYYRIRVPVHGREDAGGNGDQAACLSFRPETDTIFLVVDNRGDEKHFADLVHDALAYDHQGIGILHMAIGCRGSPENLHLPLQPSVVHSCARAALSQTLGRLQSISLVHNVHSEGRQMFASLGRAEARFNRAFPLWSSAASFTVLHEDPRPIGHHLDKLYIGIGPRGLIRAWQTLEAAYKPLPPASSTPPTRRIRVLLAAVGQVNLASYSDVVGLANRKKVCSFRDGEENTWKIWWRVGGFHNQLGHGMLNPDDEDPDGSLEFAKTNNAVGFWSLPLEAFDDVPDVPDGAHFSGMSRVVDLTEFRAQMECGLFEI